MLVLTRKEDQVIQIGSDVTIRVLSIGRGRIRLGIDAPSETKVRRGELADAPQAAATRMPLNGLAVGGTAAANAIIDLELQPV